MRQPIKYYQHIRSTFYAFLLLSFALVNNCASNNPSLTQCADGVDCNSLIGVDDLNASITITDQDCDDIEDDSDTDIGTDVRTTYYADADDDTYGDANSSLPYCSQPEGYTTDATDCNDSDATIHPGATETAGDGISLNCVDDVYLASYVVYTDIEGDGSKDTQRTTTYDIHQNKLTETYDSDFASADGNEEEITYTYDSEHHLTTSLAVRSGTYIKETFGDYDAQNNYQSYSYGSSCDTNWENCTFAYDSTIAYTYDSYGTNITIQISTITYVSYSYTGTLTKTNSYTYTDGGLVETVTTDSETDGIIDEMIGYEYDTDGNITVLHTDPDGDLSYDNWRVYTWSNGLLQSEAYYAPSTATEPSYIKYFSYDEHSTLSSSYFDDDGDLAADSYIVTAEATYASTE